MTVVVESKLIRVLIADDHPVVRQGLRGFIATEKDMTVVGEASSVDDAVRQALLLRPDVILLDMIMPPKDGVAAVGEIKQKFPEARILIITGFVEDEKVYAAVKQGALGYLLKGTDPHDLLDAIRKVARGEMILGSEVATRMIQALNRPQRSETTPLRDRLTERETEVLRLLARGLTNQEIARRISVSERTARNHVSSILTKLNLESRTQAALLAVQQGLM